MGYLTGFLVIILLFGVALVQTQNEHATGEKKSSQKIDKQTMGWLKNLINENNSSTQPKVPPENNAHTAPKIDSQTSDWLKGKINENTSSAKPKVLPESTTNTAPKQIDSLTSDWLKRIINENSSSAQPNVLPKNTTNTGESGAQPPPIRLDSRVDPDNYTSRSNDNRDLGECKTPEGLSGLCVFKDQCVDNHVDVTQANLRSCSRNGEVCCPWSKITRTRSMATECGWNDPRIFRINDTGIKRTYADFGEFPWMVALIMKHAGPGKWLQEHYLGGGALIHPSVVITAAHKIDIVTFEKIKCRAGEWDLQTSLEPFPHQERGVKKIIMHDDFYRSPAINDISMIVLETPFDLESTPHIGVACLDVQPPAPGTKCITMGWGKEFKGDDKQLILKKVELPFVEFNQCQDMLRRTRLTASYYLHASHLCAGGVEGVSPCTGDGGASLVCPIHINGHSTRFAVYGLYAFNVGCGGTVPAVYVNIPRMYSWVQNKMSEEGFTPTYDIQNISR